MNLDNIRYDTINNTYMIFRNGGVELIRFNATFDGTFNEEPDNIELSEDDLYLYRIGVNDGI
jgi:hypothetical protein